MAIIIFCEAAMLLAELAILAMVVVVTILAVCGIVEMKKGGKG